MGFHKSLPFKATISIMDIDPCRVELSCDSGKVPSLTNLEVVDPNVTVFGN